MLAAISGEATDVRVSQDIVRGLLYRDGGIVPTRGGVLTRTTRRNIPLITLPRAKHQLVGWEITLGQHEFALGVYEKHNVCRTVVELSSLLHMRYALS